MSQYNCSSLKELSWRGQEQILSCVGPITKSLDDSILIMKMMFNSYSECNILRFIFIVSFMLFKIFKIKINLIN